MDDWERELRGLKGPSSRPIRPDRPRRAPRANSTVRAQCQSWTTFEDQPVQCDRREHAPGSGPHRAHVFFEYDRYPEQLQW